nr:terminase [Mesorhizobium sp.]
MAERAAFQTAVDQFLDVRWRLNNLYWIVNKEGQRTLFQMNWAQERLFNEMHYLNVILKARQLGFTTLIQIFMLDAAVFNSDVRCGTIAHTLGDAQTIFRDKVKLPYDNLPDGLKAAVRIASSNSTELMLSNNSSIRVGTSLRSGTLQYLHVSEYGKLCAKFPEKAREVRTGALNTVQAGQIVFIESTAEGQEGHYYETCQTAQAKQRTGAKLTTLDFKFHFYPWWKSPEYVVDPVGVVISDDMAKYFAKLAKAGIELTPAQQAWYAKKTETQLSDMKREYPSLPEEAFEAAVEGAYYAHELAALELRGRVGIFPADPKYLVHGAWDIGRHDYTAIWFFQLIGGRIRIVGYYQMAGEGLPHHAKEVKDLAAERGWTLGAQIWPHDGRVTEWGSGLGRVEQGLAHGLKIMIGADLSIDDGINAVRATLPLCEFDEGPTAEGRKALAAYRKEWSEDRGMWLDKPWL